jgi:hypothetical protein
METKRAIQKINETKIWFLEKINKIDKPLAKLIKREREKTQIHKIRHEKGTLKDIPLKSRTSLGIIFKNYTPKI